MIIYKITNKLNGHIYVGQTSGSLKLRWRQHCKKSAANNCRYLGHAIRKYGKAAFSVETIGTYSTLQDLDDAERYFIDHLNCLAPEGYNLDSGGNTRKKFHPESILKLSAARKGQRNSPATEFKPGPRPALLGAGNPRFGVTPAHSKPVKCVETGAIFTSISHVAKAFNCARSYVSRLLSKKSRGKRLKGFTFTYAPVAA